MTTLIFVHGACVRDGAWWWQRMVAPLAARGIATATVALPSCGEAGEPLGDLEADTTACRAAIAAAPDGPVVLCGHSYGGMVITGAGVDERVTHLLYVTSVMADEGESQAALIGGEPAPWMRPGENTVSVDPELVRTHFLQDCDAEATDGALARLTPQALLPFTQAPAAIAWKTTPSTYVVCTDDLATPATTQRARIRPGTRRVEFAAGHHPFLSQPDAFAAALADAVV